MKQIVTNLFLYFVLSVQSGFHGIKELILVYEAVGALLRSDREGGVMIKRNATETSGTAEMRLRKRIYT